MLSCWSANLTRAERRRARLRRRGSAPSCRAVTSLVPGGLFFFFSLNPVPRYGMQSERAIESRGCVGLAGWRLGWRVSTKTQANPCRAVEELKASALLLPGSLRRSAARRQELSFSKTLLSANVRDVGLGVHWAFAIFIKNNPIAVF